MKSLTTTRIKSLVGSSSSSYQQRPTLTIVATMNSSKKTTTKISYLAHSARAPHPEPCRAESHQPRPRWPRQETLTQVSASRLSGKTWRRCVRRRSDKRRHSDSWRAALAKTTNLARTMCAFQTTFTISSSMSIVRLRHPNPSSTSLWASTTKT